MEDTKVIKWALVVIAVVLVAGMVAHFAIPQYDYFAVGSTAFKVNTRSGEMWERKSIRLPSGDVVETWIESPMFTEQEVRTAAADLATPR